MNHPPLCPKTKEVFSTNTLGVVVFFDEEGTEMLASFEHEERPFLARYQACAWYDRHVRWSGIYNRIIWGNRSHTDRSIRCHAQARECMRVCEAWREWEKQNR